MTENIFSSRLHLRCTTLDSIFPSSENLSLEKSKLTSCFGWLLVSNKRRRSHNPLKVKDHSVHQTKLCVWSLLQICVGLVTNRILSDEEKKNTGFKMNHRPILIFITKKKLLEKIAVHQPIAIKDKL